MFWMLMEMVRWVLGSFSKVCYELGAVRALLEMVRELQVHIDGLFLSLELLSQRFSDLEIEI